ncbi:MAG: hypothetical protein II158_03545 [Bacilli bacterium]|nr:hypothetical protein [Bacilli bacterium]
MENKTCPICGNPTRVYMGNARKDGLCGYHADLLKAEKIVLKDGVYVYTNTGLPVGAKKEASTPKAAEQKAPEAKAATGICPICGKAAKPGEICLNDYREAKDLAVDLIKQNKDQRKLVVYYRNLRRNMYQMYSEDILRENAVKLVGIAIALRDGFHYDIYFKTVYEDVAKIMESHRKKKPNESQVAKAMDEQGGQVFTSTDGHVLDSPGEQTIDEILFELQRDPALLKKNIITYHIPHYDLEQVVERGMNADFYVEYWGVKNDAKYEKNKAEKIALYQSNGLPLLGIESDETKNLPVLRQRIKDFIIDQFNK